MPYALYGVGKRCLPGRGLDHHQAPCALEAPESARCALADADLYIVTLLLPARSIDEFPLTIAAAEADCATPTPR
jgi:hypothetical protein